MQAQAVQAQGTPAGSDQAILDQLTQIQQQLSAQNETRSNDWTGKDVLGQGIPLQVQEALTSMQVLTTFRSQGFCDCLVLLKVACSPALPCLVGGLCAAASFVLVV